eukprot:CAMPEP_0183538628 /NCGR_PEP_ID=MMETSP0371-20130417/29717_1 /TAXON_ID=268820 /ORGANISM="Peridinium aciculiferum, Strain PAER-2" /LENGTH=69 /DNA_ID=CAMNT_0025739489 /DNA_START=57 /DNA_END=263 /DNA_ORIENTATION=+
MDTWRSMSMPVCIAVDITEVSETWSCRSTSTLCVMEGSGGGASALPFCCTPSTAAATRPPSAIQRINEA